MKAVIEFNYPEDEDALRHALNGGKAIFALDQIRQSIRSWEKHDGLKADGLVEQIRDIVFDALKDCGEN